MTSVNPLTPFFWSRDQSPMPYPPWLKLGFITPRRIYGSHLYFPGAVDRALISGGHDTERFTLAFGDPPSGTVALQSRDTQDRQIVPYGEVTLLSVACYGYTQTEDERGIVQTASTNFRVQIYHVDAEGRPQLRWQRDGINGPLFGGAFGEPLSLRTPVVLPDQQPIMVRVTNLTTTPLYVQVAFDCSRRRYA